MLSNIIIALPLNFEICPLANFISPPELSKVPSLIVKALIRIKSASPVKIPSVSLSIVIEFCIVKPLVALPNVKVKSFKFRVTKVNASSLVSEALPPNSIIVFSKVKVPSSFLKLPLKIHVLLLKSSSPGSEREPPSSILIIPPVEVTRPLLIFSEAKMFRSACSVIIPSVLESIVTEFCIVKSLVALPNVKVELSKLRPTKLNTSISLVNLILFFSSRFVSERVRVPLDSELFDDLFSKSPPKAQSLPVRSNSAEPERRPPLEKEILPPEDLIRPSPSIITNPPKSKSASLLKIPSVVPLIVNASVTLISLVSLPNVKVL